MECTKKATETVTSMAYQTWPMITESIEKIEKKLDQNNDQEWNQEDQMKASLAVNKIFLATPYVEIWEKLTKGLHTKYAKVLINRLMKKVIPSLEQKRTSKLLFHQILEEWSLFDTYTRNVLIIFMPVEEMGRNPMVLDFNPLPLRVFAKLLFCSRVWTEFHHEIDNLLPEMIDAGMFTKKDGKDDEDIERIRLLHFFYEMYQMQYTQIGELLQTTFNILKEKKIVS
ncbi:hypothetical protein CsatB_029641 [Cannabis sativa]|uniref:Uncharacterized protein n=1 Tax=Cannabis sativa TaxID=3483 RepID=A0A7J6FGA2_CANSA|nr:uncharacterized protein LOC133034030 [Cannabis sativa]KAF4369685.1 hypothetical protein F8388_015772 [Cannabis sativa]